MRPNTQTPEIQYIQEIFAKEDSDLQKTRLSVPDNCKHMQIGPDEGKLIHTLVKLANCQSFVEIGTLVGYSSLWIAKALKPDGILYTVDKDENNFTIAKSNIENSSLRNKIFQKLGDAPQVLDELASLSPFDGIFIDADKGGYLDYLIWAEKNIKKGGIIIADNTFLFGSVYLDEAPKGISKTSHKIMQEFNKRISDQDKYTSILFPSKEGLTVARKEF